MSDELISYLIAGDKAPEFSLTDQSGNLFSIDSLKGKKIVLYFYPNDDSQTCIKEACNLRDNYAMLIEKGFEVIGVSHAPVESKKKFARKFDLPFTLLSDPDLSVCKLYGVYGDKFFMGRWLKTIHRITFIINETGIIERIIYPVKSGSAAEQITGVTP
ncbi:MAG: thioredoxin-dependent thiol peroxidase [Chitinophagales bacterium]